MAFFFFFLFKADKKLGHHQLLAVGFRDRISAHAYNLLLPVSLIQPKPSQMWFINTTGTTMKKPEH